MRHAMMLAVAALLACACQALRVDHASTPTLRKIVVNGAEIAYAEEGAGETVVFLHGVGSDLRIWGDVRPYIAARYRFVAYSRRHHAPNAWPDDGHSHTIAQHVEDLAQFIRALGVSKAHVVAVSLGARIATEMVLAHPERVASFVINDGLVAAPAAAEGKRVMEDFFRPFAPIEDAAQAGNAPEAAIGLVDWLYGRAGAWNELPEYRRQSYRDNARTLLLALRNDAAARRPSCDAIGQMQVPVLVLDGVDTPAAFRLTNDGLIACLPSGAERARIPAAGHFWYVDNPRGGAEAILRFLATHPI